MKPTTSYLMHDFSSHIYILIMQQFILGESDLMNAIVSSQLK